MWREAHNLDHAGLRMAQCAVGALVVTSKEYTIRGEPTVIPGHIGIVTRISGDGIDFIHANPKTGKVEEAPMHPHAPVLGYLALNYN